MERLDSDLSEPRDSELINGTEIGEERSIRFGDSVADLTGSVHQLPCCIKYNGPSPVSHYFKPKMTGVAVDGLVMEEAHFRGRKLQGTTVSLPDGFCGFVLGKPPKNENVSEEKLHSWETKAKFKRVTLWNHDILPSKDDTLIRTFHWFQVSKALHKPVTSHDLDSMQLILSDKR